ncbi:unnamed protein product [Rotaria sordida]|uniref:Uncharacterized protein n=1 Tax=Rotaria sordida TaxID=392033 RepID=A0A815SAQ7_9BILA|nr:unnamed protein product [Rotaria sordida]
MTPYEIVFGQKPRVDFELWKSISEQGIENEEDLPATVLNQLTVDIDSNLMPNELDNINGIDAQKSSISSNLLSNASNSITPLHGAIHTTAAISSPQVNGSVDTNTESEETTQHFDEASTCNLGATNSAHLPIRQRAQDAYLSNADKRIKKRHQYIEGLWFGIINQWWPLESVVKLSAVPE